MNALDSIFFKTIADQAIMGITAFDKSDYRCLYINTLAREIFEIAPELPCENIDIKSFEPKKPRREMRNFSHDIFNFEGLMRDVLMSKNNGYPFIADVGIKHIEVGSQKTLLLMVQDVTMQKKMQRELSTKQAEIKKAYEELIEQNKQLKELDLAKDRFIALTTHELRTPLAAIVATAEVLHIKLYDNDTQRNDFITTVYEQSMHLMKLVNDILDFAKIQAGKLDFFIGQNSIEEVLDLQITNFYSMAESRGLKLIYTPPLSTTTAYFDGLRLSEVFSNVINNAVKFSSNGGTINVSTRTAEERVIVSVSDQGKGIHPDNFDKVFNEFETVGNIKTHQKGTGLGMPISKRIMEKMGGKIWFESVVNSGTTFHIEIPTNKILDDESMYRDRPADLDDLLATIG